MKSWIQTKICFQVERHHSKFQKHFLPFCFKFCRILLGLAVAAAAVVGAIAAVVVVDAVVVVVAAAAVCSNECKSETNQMLQNVAKIDNPRVSGQLALIGQIVYFCVDLSVHKMKPGWPLR